MNTPSKQDVNSDLQDSLHCENSITDHAYHTILCMCTVGHSLTGRVGPLVTTLLKQMRECTLAMGLSQHILLHNEETMHSLATNLSLYLSALNSIIPHQNQFSSLYRSPCWLSPINLSYQKQRVIRLLSRRKHLSGYCRDRIQEILNQNILLPAFHNEMMCLPAFFLAGFPKSGTTTLHSVLYKHDMILRPEPKESHWWTRMPLHIEDNNYLRLAAIRYLEYYHDKAILKNPQLLTYDASQSTLWDSNFLVDNEDYCAMPIAVSHILPSAKFIVVMRNPVT